MVNNIKYSVKDLQKIIDDYFKKTAKEEWTVTGLALCVGSKQLLNDYQKRPDYKDMVKVAKLKIEHSYELSLRSKGGAHNIFALKNFGWTDNYGHELSGKDGEPIEHKVIVIKPKIKKENAN